MNKCRHNSKFKLKNFHDPPFVRSEWILTNRRAIHTEHSRMVSISISRSNNVTVKYSIYSFNISRTITSKKSIILLNSVTYIYLDLFILYFSVSSLDTNVLVINLLAYFMFVVCNFSYFILLKKCSYHETVAVQEDGCLISVLHPSYISPRPLDVECSRMKFLINPH